MKKVLSLGFVALFALSLSSCKKDYTCDCDVLGFETSTTFNDVNKDDAETLESTCTSSEYCTWNEA